jgi:hypothetical protein
MGAMKKCLTRLESKALGGDILRYFAQILQHCRLRLAIIFNPNQEYKLIITE